MTTWYSIGDASYAIKIKPVEIERATDKSVYIDGHRRDRVSTYRSYFPTWEEARDLLLERAESEVGNARRRLEFANGRLGNVKGMKKP